MPKLNNMNGKDQKKLASKDHGKNGEACNLDRKGGDNAGLSHLLPLVILPTCSFIDCLVCSDWERKCLTELSNQALNLADSRASGHPLLSKKGGNTIISVFYLIIKSPHPQRAKHLRHNGRLPSEVLV